MPQMGAVMKISVDYDKCQSNAVCVGYAPQVFEVREDGYLYLFTDTPPEKLRGAVDKAQKSCPTQAITVED